MRSFIATAAIALAASSVVSAVPSRHSSSGSKLVQLPLGDGFPNPSMNQLDKIQDNAFGTLSNLPPPPKLDIDSLRGLQLVAFNELFEVFFFENLLIKLLDNGPAGRKFKRDMKTLNVDEDTLVSSIKAIVAVEELHAINANNALKKLGGLVNPPVHPIKACKYQWPAEIDSVAKAIGLASRFTDLVEGTLQDVIFHAAKAGDAGLTVGVASSAEDEGEQQGGFRLWLNQKRPQSQPFHTRSVREYAFSKLQDFVVPGSCPNGAEIDLTVFQPLEATADPNAETEKKGIKFVYDDNEKLRRASPKDSSVRSFAAKVNNHSNVKNLFITYLNGQNIITVPVKHEETDGTKHTLTAPFPQSENNMFGPIIAVLTTGASSYTNITEVVADTIRGPAVLEFQESRFAVL